MRRITRQPLPARINDQVKVFQQNLTDQNGHRIRDLHNVGRTLASLNCQPSGSINGNLRDT
jgi:hypothetical protein